MIHGHLDFVFYDESSLRMIVQFEGERVKDVYGKQRNNKLYLDENLMLITWSIQFLKSALYASQTSIRPLIPL